MVNFLVDLRSEDEEQLVLLDQAFLHIVDRHSGPGIHIICKRIGERPSGRNREPCDLQDRVAEIRSSYGKETVFKSSSTDANIPLSRGIPAVAFGIYEGGGAHTPAEYIELNTLNDGYAILLHTMLDLCCR
jgi:acetylornithine deacetylase/succinyl-diaminopimelate desuccinylase-like protein